MVQPENSKVFDLPIRVLARQLATVVLFTELSLFCGWDGEDERTRDRDGGPIVMKQGSWQFLAGNCK